MIAFLSLSYVDAIDLPDGGDVRQGGKDAHGARNEHFK